MSKTAASKKASYWIEKLKLVSHVEGGAYRETYRAQGWIPGNHLPEAFSGDRNYSTCIYFLLQQGEFSALHRIASDEVWHFYDGSPLEVIEITVDGTLLRHLLGNNPDNGESFQCVVKAGSWFGSHVAGSGEYALAGCTVSPGFDFTDFELGNNEVLSLQFPDHKEIITQFTR